MTNGTKIYIAALILIGAAVALAGVSTGVTGQLIAKRELVALGWLAAGFIGTLLIEALTPEDVAAQMDAMFSRFGGGRLRTRKTPWYITMMQFFGVCCWLAGLIGSAWQIRIILS